MERAIRQIDLALRKLYNLDTPLKVENYLVLSPGTTSIYERLLQGALVIKESPDLLELGIYFSPQVRKSLTQLPTDPKKWNLNHLQTVSVASEELSHFHYVVYHGSRRSVSHLELELQAEVDKFLILFFALFPKYGPETFDKVYTYVFESFYWQAELSPERLETYKAAHQMGKSFLKKISKDLQNFNLAPPRKFYSLGSPEKYSF